VLDGSVQRDGNRMKINVQLVHAADATILWSETYDRELSDFFAVQDEITSAIVAALELRIRPNASTRAPSQKVRNVAAYELYLRGRQLFATSTDRASIAHAQRYFEEALRLDPQLAAAHAGLSDIYTRLAIFGHMPAADGFARAKESARHALALDSTVAEAHTALAHALCVSEFAWDDADRSFERAIALNPTYTFGRLPYAICLMSRKRFRDAERQLRAAQSIDPLSPMPSNLMGRLYVGMQQPDRAIPHLVQALELSPQMDLAWQVLGHAYLQKNMAAQAIDALERAAALSGARDSAHLAYAYATTGQHERAHAIVQQLIQREDRTSQLAYHIAVAYTGLGDTDAAFTWLTRSFDGPASFAVGANIDPALEPLRADPRWQSIVQRLRLPR
jgi:tetratricopeptide (TPR) repeat protein